MRTKIRQFFDYYVVYFIVAAVLLAIAGYFVKTIVFDRTEIVLSVMILGDGQEVDTDQMKENLEAELGVTSPKQEVTVTFMDGSVSQNEAIIWTRLRAKAVDVLITNSEMFEQFAMNGVYANLNETFSTEDLPLLQGKLVEGKTAVLDDEENVTEWGEALPYGVTLHNDSGYALSGSGIKNPVAGIVVNTEHKEKAMEAVAWLTGI